jgi:hypothetical protein
MNHLRPHFCSCSGCFTLRMLANQVLNAKVSRDSLVSAAVQDIALMKHIESTGLPYTPEASDMALRCITRLDATLIGHRFMVGGWTVKNGRNLDRRS